MIDAGHSLNFPPTFCFLEFGDIIRVNSWIKEVEDLDKHNLC